MLYKPKGESWNIKVISITRNGSHKGRKPQEIKDEARVSRILQREDGFLVHDSSFA